VFRVLKIGKKGLGKDKKHDVYNTWRRTVHIMQVRTIRSFLPNSSIVREGQGAPGNSSSVHQSLHDIDSYLLVSLSDGGALP